MVKYVFGTTFLRALTFMKRRERITCHFPPCSVKSPPQGGGGHSPPTGNLKQKPCPSVYICMFIDFVSVHKSLFEYIYLFVCSYMFIDCKSI